MAKEIHSEGTGHTSRTFLNKNINNNSIKLFGVEITLNNVSPSGQESRSGTGGRNVRSCSSSKGRRWSEDEQRGFLIGLEKLGKGNWVGIAKDFVPSRTPTQVASHAQKYFDRQKDENRASKRHKCSVFDINLDEESSNTTNTCPSSYAPTYQSFTKEAASVPLKKSTNKGKELLNQESPISPIPVSYRIPVRTGPWVSFNGAYAYVSMTNYTFPTPNFASSSTNANPLHRVSSQSNSASLDNLDLTL
ncbi:unnamed protein product [Withania somnifera]